MRFDLSLTGILARVTSIGRNPRKHQLWDANAMLAKLAEQRPAMSAVLSGQAVAVPVELTEDLRRAVWRAQYEHHRATSNPEISDERIATAVEARIADPVQRAIDLAAHAAYIDHARRSLPDFGAADA